MIILLFTSFLDLIELRQTYLSNKKDEENSKQVSVIHTDIDCAMTTRDIGCQFNYLVPSLGKSLLSIILLY